MTAISYDYALAISRILDKHTGCPVHRGADVTDMIAAELHAAWNHGHKLGQEDLEDMKRTVTQEIENRERAARRVQALDRQLLDTCRDLDAAQVQIEELKEKLNARTDDV